MKGLMRIINIVVAAALSAAFFMSCSYEESETGIMKDYPVCLTADSPATKLALDGLDLSWEENDRIRITATASDNDSGTAELTVYSIDESDNGKAVFSGFVNMTSQPVDCYFTYPASNTIIDTDPSTGKITAYLTKQTGFHQPFFYGYSEYNEAGMPVSLNHIGAMLEINVSASEVAFISFLGNEKEVLSPVIVDPKTGKYESPSQPNVQITVPRQNGSTYILVPPFLFKKGFTLILSDAQGKSMFKSYSSDGTLDGGYDFSDKKGHLVHIDITDDFIPLGSLDEEGQFNPSGLEISEFEFVHNTSGGLLSGTDVSFKLSKSGAPDKLIEAWGAELIRYEKDEQGKDVKVVYRSVEFTNTEPNFGTSITMTPSDGWKLLPEGTYLLAPYYYMYGVKRSLPTKPIDVSDPGVSITINGTTSYDKYKAGQVSQANSHAFSLIDDVSVSINVHDSILDSFTASFNNDEVVKTKTNLRSGSVSFENLTKTAYGSYPLSVNLKIGNLNISDKRDFVITGLPYSINLNVTSLHSTWLHNNIKIAQDHYLFQVGTSSIISPRFHFPEAEAVNVKAVMNAYAYQGWGDCDPSAWISAISGTKASKSGSSTSYDGQQFYPDQADECWKDTSRDLVMSNEFARTCVYVESTKSSGLGGLLYGFGPGLVARSFTLNYR